MAATVASTKRSPSAWKFERRQREEVCVCVCWGGWCCGSYMWPFCGQVLPYGSQSAAQTTTRTQVHNKFDKNQFKMAAVTELLPWWAWTRKTKLNWRCRRLVVFILFCCLFAWFDHYCGVGPVQVGRCRFRIVIFNLWPCVFCFHSKVFFFIFKHHLHHY